MSGYRRLIGKRVRARIDIVDDEFGLLYPAGTEGEVVVSEMNDPDHPIAVSFLNHDDSTHVSRDEIAIVPATLDAADGAP